MSVLVTGGAGYIGSHAVLALLDAGIPVVCLDNLSNAARGDVPAGAAFIEGDVGDRALVDRVIAEHGITAVMHFAASIVVPESVADPLKYYRNNTGGSRRLIEACIAAGIGTFVFSSTAAVYGEPERIPVAETAPTRPINPYGRSKLVTEWMLEDAAKAHGLRYVALRYFNVAGADPAGRAGQSSPNATHVIKVACEAATGKRAEVQLFGEDHPTPDGTCIRDYVHVTDLAQAHLLALDHLEQGGASLVANCGYGRGYSVREVFAAVERVAGRPLPVRPAPRRAGDPSALVADGALLRRELGWEPRHADLDTIVGAALAWERQLRQREAAPAV